MTPGTPTAATSGGPEVRRTRAVRPGSRTTKAQTADALTILKEDHRAVDALFHEFETTGPRAVKTRRKLVDRMIDQLSVHAFIEEQVLYPAARREVPSAGDDVLEALEEHHVVKWQLQELIDLDPSDERFRAKVAVLSENVRHHVKEEEADLFPLLRTELGRSRLLELGDELDEAKRIAPHHPHPRIAPHPAEHLLPEAVTSVIDRAREAITSVRSGS